MKRKKERMNGANILNGAELNIRKVPNLVGEEPVKRVEEILDLMKQTNIPLLLIGESGTGKSAVMQVALRAYAAWQTMQRYALPKNDPLWLDSQKIMPDGTKGELAKAYYFQLSADDTKTSIFLGNRMIEGTYKTVKGILAIAAEQHAVVGVDEIGHGTQSLITLFNAFDGGASIISNGDVAIDASGMRIIYGTNRSNYAGNIALPQSFTNRVLGIPFDYPNEKDEHKIALAVAKKSFVDKNKKIDVPVSVSKYITAFIREMRTETFPLSARNISRGIVMCQLAQKKNIVKTDSYFERGSNIEAVRRMISRRISGVEAINAEALATPEIMQFIEYVSRIGVANFKEILLKAANYYVDSEGLDFGDTIKEKIKNSLI